MGIFWLGIGIALGCVYLWLQWIQVKNISVGTGVSRVLFSLLFSFRLVLFVVVTGFALRQNFIYGLFLFAGFWIARSLLLVLIGSGHVNCYNRRNL